VQDTQWLLIKLPSFWFLRCEVVNKGSRAEDKPAIFIFRTDELVHVDTGVTPQGKKMSQLHKAVRGRLADHSYAKEKEGIGMFQANRSYVSHKQPFPPHFTCGCDTDRGRSL
jgi:hypothetical protein